MNWLTVRLNGRRWEAEDIDSFEFVRPDGGDLPAFEAGAHIDVEIGDGLVRQYSLCNDPAERHRYVVAVLKEPHSRGGSQAMHERLVEGQQLRISTPRNCFALEESAAFSVLLAGGIGVTPMLSMAEKLAREGAPFAFRYCTRSVQRTAFADRIAASPFAYKAFIHHDDGPVSQRFDAEAAIGAPVAGKHLYVCGPSGFMQHVLDTAKRMGWPDAQVHREYFAAPAQLADAPAENNAFEVVIASTGRVIAIPADQTVAEALIAQGVPLVVSCEQGICGTCVTTVLEGEPDHRDHYLTDADHARNDCFTPCCSRARSARLVLDF